MTMKKDLEPQASEILSDFSLSNVIRKVMRQFIFA